MFGELSPFRTMLERLCWESKNDTDFRYARKELSTLDKLTKQLFFALRDGREGSGIDTWTRKPFVSVPMKSWYSCCRSKIAAPFTSAVSQFLGGRWKQEDRFLDQGMVPVPLRDGQTHSGRLFGVFDGHGDDGRTGDFLRENLGRFLEEALLGQAWNPANQFDEEIVTNAFVKAFQQAKVNYRDSGGATAACVLVCENKIYCPNVGDSRVILVKQNGKTYQLSEDANLIVNQKMSYEAIEQKKRFLRWHQKMKNVFFKYEPNSPDQYVECKEGEKPDRVGGALLNVMREIGFKWSCCRPKITRVFIGEGEDDLAHGIIYCNRGDFLVIASDGYTGVATLEETGKVVRQLAEERCSPQEIAEALAKGADNAMAEARKGGNANDDNVTVMVIAI